MIKTGLSGYVYGFTVSYNATDTSDIVDILKYLVKKVLKIILQAFIALLNFAGLLDCVAESSDGTKCVSFNNKPCLGRSISYWFKSKWTWSLFIQITVSLYICDGRSTLDDVSSRICVSIRQKIQI